MKCTTFLLMLALISAAPRAATVQTFDKDPKWEGFRNRLTRDPPRITHQDFGYSHTNHTSASAGEVGGYIQRSVEPASYAKPIARKTLRDKLRASGRFVVPAVENGSGACFGWFNSTSSRGWRTPDSLAFRIDGNRGNYWVFYEYGTHHGLTGGAGCFEGKQYQTTKTKPLAVGNAVHEWSLVYDPDGAEGNGLVTFTLDGRAYPLPLADGHKQDGAEFDRFGIFNQRSYGDGLTAWFGDLTLDGAREPLDNEPKWIATGNHTRFLERYVRPFHQFGYSDTQFCRGQKPGEVGGIIWRDEAPAYYAESVGPFSLDDELFASGKIVMTGAAADSGVYLGWFNAESKQSNKTPENKQPQKNTLAILVEGPSRVGHYFRPAVVAGSGDAQTCKTGPLIRPDGVVHDWSIHYQPHAAGHGRISVTFDGNPQDLELSRDIREQGASFNRFGLFNIQSGGQFVELYVDDVSHTVPAR